MSRQRLLEIIQTGINANLPENCMRGCLPNPPKGKTIVIGAGKGAAAMARFLETHWDGELIGRVVTRYGSALPCRSIEVLEAAHPMPDQNSADAARSILKLASDLSEDDLIINLLSGGGSALMCAPLNGISLAEKQQLTQQLILSGASIAEINCLRKHLSLVKGGRMAAAAFPASVCNIVISDVVGDDLSVISSGPFSPDPSTCDEALVVLQKHNIEVPEHIAALLAAGNHETPKPGDPIFERVMTKIIGSNQLALNSAAAAAASQGLQTRLLGDDLEGSAIELASWHAEHILSSEPGTVLLSGGEATVQVHGNGRGGPNLEFCLALVIALEGKAKVSAIAVDTDGFDGSSGVAGAYIDESTLHRARAKGLEPAAYLANNDSGAFFVELDNQIELGHTQTNVNDLRAILISANQP